MLRNSAIFATVGFLSGCATAQLNHDLQDMSGRSIKVAISHFGYPDAVREMMGDKIYIWSTDSQAILPINTTSTSYGTYGYQTTNTMNMMPVTAACTIQIAVDENDRIKNFQWEGNQIGCRRYTR